jgi:predicted ATPase
VIRKVHFQNFRCLRDVELTLEPLTVLVGPNSSGKTTVLEGLKPKRNFVDTDRWRQDETLQVSIRWEFTDDTYRMMGLAAAGKTWEAEQPKLPRRIVPHVLQSLALDLRDLRSQNILASANNLSRSGDNLTNVFATLSRKQQEAVAKELCQLVPMFNDIDRQPTAEGRHQLRFQDHWNPDLWFAPDAVSDGTMLLLAFIVLQYQNPSPEIITIEEPERALHPYLLDELIQMLRKMSTGEIGRHPVQVVLATHSAELLEYVNPEEVRFLTRSQEDGSVQVNQAAIDTPNWRRVYEEYNRSLGGIWLSGGMGGVPGA